MTEAHNAAAADLWGHTGAHYDFISFGLADGLCHAVQTLWPRPGERILDIATGTGWTARLVASQGADTIGVDIADGMLAAARTLSAHLGPRLEFRRADAEALPFEDGAFDAVISTYGIMFAGRPERAAAEVKRVIRPGGRLIPLNWLDTTDGYIANFFGLIGRNSGAPPPEVSPMVWGNVDWLQATLGGAFDIETRPLTTTLFAPDGESLWQKYHQGFGPIRVAWDNLSPDRQAAFRDDFIALNAAYADGGGLCIPRRALLVRGVRK